MLCGMDLSCIATFVALALMIATPTLASVPDDALAEAHLMQARLMQVQLMQARLMQDSAQAPAVIQAGAAGAAAGRADDELLVGEAYDRGKGLPQDDRAAAQWYGRAASHGSVKGMVEFAVALEDGMGVAADPARAVGLYRAAARAGSAMAETRLGMALQWGHGVAPDPCAAAFHYQRAVQQGEMMALVYDSLRLPSSGPAIDCMLDQTD